MRQMWPVATVVVAFAGMGLFGTLRPAPGDSADALAAQARLDAVPLVLGKWQGIPATIPAKQLRIAEAQAHLSRSYARGQDRVNVLVLAGASGPLGAHTPETCFAGSGYQLEGVASAVALPAGAGSLWRGRFNPPPTAGSPCEVTWGWGNGVTWVASSDPRFEFAGRNLLYKLYVTTGADPTGTSRAAEDFLARFLPAFAATP